MSERDRKAKKRKEKSIVLHGNQLNRREFLRTSAVAGAATVLAAPASPEKTQGPLPWLVGAGMADITPPLEVGTLGSSTARLWKPFEGVRLPLHARAVVVQKGDRRIAVVALELLGLASEAVGGMNEFKKRIAAESGHAVTPENLVLACIHSHSAPETLAMSDLPQTEPFRQWIGFLAQRIGSAIQSAAGSMRPCNLLVGCQSAPGLATYRRIMTNRGILQPHSIRPADIVIGPEGPADDSVHIAAFVDQSNRPVAALVKFLARQIGFAIQSAAGSMHPCNLVVGCQSVPGLAVYRRIMTNRGILQPHSIRPADIVIGPEGPTDDSVHIAAFVNQSGNPVAILVNATAHPVYEMVPHRLVSPDYPGEMSIELEKRHPGLVALFLQGAAGNINSIGISVAGQGAAEARQHGQRLADVVDKALGGLRPVGGDELALCWRTVNLPRHTASGQPAAEPVSITIGAARIGNANFLFLPGEPFIETALGIRKVFSPVEFLQVVGYAEAYIGYIPTDLAFDNGGYECDPAFRWPWVTRVGRGSEPIIRQEALKLLRAVRGSETKNSN